MSNWTIIGEKQINSTSPKGCKIIYQVYVVTRDISYQLVENCLEVAGPLFLFGSHLHVG